MPVYTHEYSRDYEPPAPVIEISISKPEPATREARLTALVDSGADATMIPIDALSTVEARYVETLYMRGVASIRLPVDTYLITVRVGRHTIRGIQAVAVEQDADALVGRDVMNQLIVILNGLAGVTEISD